MTKTNGLFNELDVDEVYDKSDRNIRDYDFALCIPVYFSTKKQENKYVFFKQVVNSVVVKKVIGFVENTMTFYECDLFGMVIRQTFRSDQNIVNVLDDFEGDEVDGVRIYSNFNPNVNIVVGSWEFIIVFGINRSRMNIKDVFKFVWGLFSIVDDKSSAINEITAFSDYGLSQDDFKDMYESNTLNKIMHHEIIEYDLRGFYTTIIGTEIELNEWFRLMTLEANARIKVSISQNDVDMNYCGIKRIQSSGRDIIRFADYYNYIVKNKVMIEDMWFQDAGSFNDGIASVQRVRDKRYIYIDLDGNPIVNVAFAYAGSFEGDYALVGRTKEPSYNIIDKSFKLISKKWFYHIFVDDVPHLGNDYNYVQVGDNNKCVNFIDKDGNLVFDKWHDEPDGDYYVKTQNGDCTLVINGMKARIFNMKTGLLNDEWFDAIHFNNTCNTYKTDDVFVVYKDNKCNVMSDTGKLKYDEWISISINKSTPELAKIQELINHKCEQLW